MKQNNKLLRDPFKTKSTAMKNGHKLFLLLTFISYVLLYGAIALLS
jgi:hypothetical protein